MVRDKTVAGMLLVGTADPDILGSFLQFVPHVVLLDNGNVKGHRHSVFSDGFSGASMETILTSIAPQTLSKKQSPSSTADISV